MKTFSLSKLSETIIHQKKTLHLNQTILAEKTGINRAMISRIEKMTYTPSIDQLEKQPC